MKMFFLVLVCSCGICRTNAQEIDSARRKIDSDSVSISQPPIPGKQSPELNNRLSFTDENSVKLQREEVPPTLQRVLQDVQYRGWENGAVYRNTETNQYKVEVINGMKKETYYFENDGTAIKIK
jgi:hypothetical protein